jgi:hypothetical protein
MLYGIALCDFFSLADVEHLYQGMVAIFGMSFTFLGGVDALLSIIERLHNRIRGGGSKRSR